MQVFRDFIFLLQTRIHLGKPELEIHILHTKLTMQLSQIAIPNNLRMSIKKKMCLMPGI